MRADPKEDYNPVFEKLVDDDRVTGFLAYGFYKIAKREWTEGIWQKNQRGPNHEELRDYVTAITPTILESYLGKAVATLAEYSDEIITKERPRIEADALRGRFWVAVAASCLGAFIYSLLLILLAIILNFAGVDLLNILTS